MIGLLDTQGLGEHASPIAWQLVLHGFSHTVEPDQKSALIRDVSSFRGQFTLRRYI